MRTFVDNIRFPPITASEPSAASRYAITTTCLLRQRSETDSDAVMCLFGELGDPDAGVEGCAADGRLDFGE